MRCPHHRNKETCRNVNEAALIPTDVQRPVVGNVRQSSHLNIYKAWQPLSVREPDSLEGQQRPTINSGPDVPPDVVRRLKRHLGRRGERYPLLAGDSGRVPQSEHPGVALDPERLVRLGLAPAIERERLLAGVALGGNSLGAHLKGFDSGIFADKSKSRSRMGANCVKLSK